jgi:hypothetical protein
MGRSIDTRDSRGTSAGASRTSDGCRTQEHRIHDAEDRGIGADAERQRQNGGGGESRLPGEQPDGEANVMAHGPLDGPAHEKVAGCRVGLRLDSTLRLSERFG